MARFTFYILILLCAVGAGPASARDTHPTEIDLFPPSYPNRSELKACGGHGESEKGRVAACNIALSMKELDRAVRARFLHYRSIAKLESGDFAGAVRDADASAMLDKTSPTIDGQRCWARAVANKELAKAKELCLSQIARGGMNASIVDSLALINLRNMEWVPAVEAYYLLKVFDEPKYMYGLFLANSAYVVSDACDVKICKPAMKEKSKLYLDSIPENELNAAEAYYRNFGITLKSVEEAAVKRAKSI